MSDFCKEEDPRPRALLARSLARCGSVTVVQSPGKLNFFGDQRTRLYNRYDGEMGWKYPSFRLMGPPLCGTRLVSRGCTGRKYTNAAENFHIDGLIRGTRSSWLTHPWWVCVRRVSRKLMALVTFLIKLRLKVLAQIDARRARSICYERIVKQSISQSLPRGNRVASEPVVSICVAKPISTQNRIHVY